MHFSNKRASVGRDDCGSLNTEWKLVSAERRRGEGADGVSSIFEIHIHHPSRSSSLHSCQMANCAAQRSGAIVPQARRAMAIAMRQPCRRDQFPFRIQRATIVAAHACSLVGKEHKNLRQNFHRTLILRGQLPKVRNNEKIFKSLRSLEVWIPFNQWEVKTEIYDSVPSWRSQIAHDIQVFP